MDDTLSKLLGSARKVKILRLFLFNPEEIFTAKEVASRVRVPRREVSSLLKPLAAIKLISKNSRGRVAHFTLNLTFPYRTALQNLLLNASTNAEDIYKYIRRDAVIKLVVVSGIFVGEWEGRIDLLVVADRVKERALNKHIGILESEIGREIRYTVLSTQEFFYRLNINDHLLRDVLDYTHKIMFDRLDIGLK